MPKWLQKVGQVLKEVAPTVVQWWLTKKQK